MSTITLLAICIGCISLCINAYQIAILIKRHHDIKKWEKEEKERRIQYEREAREFWREWRRRHPDWKDWDTSCTYNFAEMFRDMKDWMDS